MNNKLGEYLKRLRGTLSLREAAKRTDGKLSHNTISQAEKGTNSHGKPFKPTPETLKVLADVYGADYSVLMNLAGYLLPPSNVQVKTTSDSAIISVEDPNHSEDELDSITSNSVEHLANSNKIPVYSQDLLNNKPMDEQTIIGLITVDDRYIQKYDKSDLFAVHITDGSMNKVIPENYVAIFQSGFNAEDKDIVIASANNGKAVIRRLTKTSLALILESESFSEKHSAIVLKRSENDPYRILGTYLYATSLSF